MSNTEIFVQSILLPSKKVLPAKCKVLRGTILGDKLSPNNSLQQLHPRLFERVQVCPNCFLVYNDWTDNNMQSVLEHNGKHYLEDEDEILPVDYSVNKIKIRREPNYMGELGAALHRYNRNIIKKIYLRGSEMDVMKKEKSVFDCKKKSIDNAIRLEEFMKGQHRDMH